MSVTTRNHYLHCAAFFLLFSMVPSAFAVPIYAIDNKVGEANLGNSGDAAEKQALADLLGVDASTLVQDIKDETPTAVDNDIAVDNDLLANSWYLDVAPTEPGWFLLKFGTGGTSATANTFFFENLADLTKLVWTNDQVQGLSGGGGQNTNIGRLSHYTTYNPNSSVPEPLTLGLLGVGLLGVGAARRRRKTL